MSNIVAFTGGNRRSLDIAPGRVVIDGKPMSATLRPLTHGLHLLTLGEETYEVFCEKHSENHVDVWVKHFIITVTLEDLRSRLLSEARETASSGSTATIVYAPMPGLVRAVEVKLGDIVEPGQGLVVLEAMKMENEIRSTVTGRVREIKVSDRMAVEKNQQLLIIEPLPS